MPENNSKKESNEKNKPQEQRGSRSGGFVELLKNIINVLFNSVVDLPQQEQYMESTNQGLDAKRKSPEDLNPEAKLKVEEAAKGLKERLQKFDTSNQSIEVKVPDQQEINSSKTMER
ncbi:hypothetical protein [Candidatus Wolbachia massiliensis]|uniref:Uncharacterized protein n=1 Tax=Candidatus Wolbachia massiliensis TaxID=1845000 RepID=A0A7L7YRG2_9RICK|nr:hypothetical protein [Candidatus Wolbachia massiliensis]QOD38336.1 hypothetical protein ID128_00105 [Candidatus Wolbachia massiliensis]